MFAWHNSRHPSIFSKKASSFCSSSSTLYFYLFSIFAYKRTRMFQSPWISKWNKYLCSSKFHRVLILLAQEIKPHFFISGIDSNICVFNNIFPIILEKNSIILENICIFAMPVFIVINTIKINWIQFWIIFFKFSI